MKWLRFILSHSLFISFCAVALCFQTSILLHLEINPYLFSFVFFSTLSGYNFYWLISKFSFRKTTGLSPFFWRNASYLFFFAAAGIGMLYCLFYLPALYYAHIAIGVLLTLAYSLPLWPFRFAVLARKAGFLKTVLLAFTWTYITVVLPSLHSSDLAHLPFTFLFAARFLFMLMLCIIFDTRDIQVDKIHALRSLATDLSPGKLQILMISIFTGYIFLGFCARFCFHDLAQEIAFLISGVFIFLVYRRSHHHQGYFFYYFLVDGLMLVSAAASWIASMY